MDNLDVIVIGGGHAGCEAALAAARMGLRTALFAMNLDSIAMMPCNPNIGGTSKGHLVREIDALGGEMGRNIDKSTIQSRMLNTSKGPAVHSLRAQADKARYSAQMRRVLDSQPLLRLIQAEVADIIYRDGRLAGVVSASGMFFACRAAVLALGTYLNARCLTGEMAENIGPAGLKSATALTKTLSRLGIGLQRFKTGTPARISAASLDLEKMTAQFGDKIVTPFSFENIGKTIIENQVSCYLTYTNKDTHEVIRKNLHRSPMHAGMIDGVGTRYCPSIEDKIVRFADKERHQVFIEPEGADTDEMYISGMSTSMPEDVQIAMYRSVAGMEGARILRFGYAIEYDCLDATQLRPTLEFKALPGLFSAGQFNGSSGYEEAAAQGLVAGINAALFVRDQGYSFTIDRSQGYIGVLLDDLTIKGTPEPYRMMTSRAEYRLLLRQDNADLRLTRLGGGLLIDEARYDAICAKAQAIEREIARVGRVNIAPEPAVNALLENFDSSPLTAGIKLAELVRRPELNYAALAPIDPARPDLAQDAADQVNIEIKYEGYIARQMAQIEQFKKLEGRPLPQNLDYSAMTNLRLEAREKLNRLRPENLGQAGRISGISPADLTVLMIYLEGRRNG